MLGDNENEDDTASMDDRGRSWETRGDGARSPEVSRRGSMAGGSRPATGQEGAVAGAFSEAQAARLTGVTLRQLGYWNRTGFFRAKHVFAGARAPFGRIYGFRDLVALRLLNSLRNDHRVPMTHLREVARALSELSAGDWLSQTLHVLNRRVVWSNPATGAREEVVGGQQVLEIPLLVVANGMRESIRRMNRRGESQVGKIVRSRYVEQNQAVLAGTRIPVASIRDLAEAGYSEAAILGEYPSLRAADVRAAIDYDEAAAA